MNTLEILHQVYAILSASSSEELERAALQVKSQRRLSLALRALAEERRRHERSVARETRSSSSALTSGDIFRAREDVQTRHEPSTNPADLERFFWECAEHLTNSQLADMLNDLGLPFRFNSRDGRKRMLDKLLKSVRIMSDSQLLSLDRSISKLRQRSQTEGWFRVIRGA